MSVSKHFHVGVKLDISAPAVVIKNNIYLFEKELCEKEARSIQNITSKIDCFSSAAHTIASEMAIENAFEITISKQTAIIRDIIIKNEIIYSHMTHLYRRIIPVIHASHNYFDFMKNNEKEYLKNNEAILKSEKILKILSKRYPHPTNMVIGGILQSIDDEEKKEAITLLKELLVHAVKTTDYLAKHQKYNLDIIDRHSCLCDLDTTPLISGKIKVNDEDAVQAAESYNLFNAENSSFVGPISRLNINRKLLSSTAEKLAKKYGLKFPISNPYQTPFCLAIESVHWIERSIETLQNTHFENETRPIFSVKEGKGHSCVESAKGTIHHYYEIDKDGKITNARIITPTEQNERFLQKAIKSLPFDPDKKTRKQMLDEIDFLIEMFYL